jgi:hypothetical protein
MPAAGLSRITYFEGLVIGLIDGLPDLYFPLTVEGTGSGTGNSREASMDQIVLERSEGWALGLADQAVVVAKRRASRLSFAVLLLFYRAYGRFPRRASEIETEAIVAVARQIEAPIVPFDVIDMGDRTLKRHRAEIRTMLGFREATVTDGEALTDWLRDHAVVDIIGERSCIGRITRPIAVRIIRVGLRGRAARINVQAVERVVAERRGV